ncbi:MAG: glutamyl-tRNA reductase [Sulfobacillus sp.]
MQIQTIGLNHHTAPLEIRERVSLTPDQVRQAYKTRRGFARIEGVVIVSTCNRTELYVAGAVTLGEVLSWWESLTGVERADFVDYLYWYQDAEAYDHLFRVASGLDSMVLGETQILGQVKDAYQLADAYKAVGPLHRLFHYALRVGKRAHSETGISHNALSMGHAVVELAKKVFGDIAPLTALVVGTGDMGALVSRHLHASGVQKILVANRTADNARALARELDATIVELTHLDEAMRQSDIIVSSTSAPAPVITVPMARRAFKGQTQRLRFLFDLAVPRDVDPGVAKLGSGIFLYDVDDLKGIVQANRLQRQKEAIKVERIIREEQETFVEELGATRVGPVIRSLREKAENIRQTELTKALDRLPNLTEQERAVVDDATRLMINKFLNDAMVSIRSWGNDGDKAVYIEALRDLFRLTEPDDGNEQHPVAGDVAPEQ